MGAGPLPPTPCPCVADGVCRPNRPSWGYSKTRWRAWPGEQARQSPTPVTRPSADEVDDQALQPFETPLPEDEDLRGPAKGRVDESTESKAEEVPVEEPGVPLPAPEALPLFDPQGNQPQENQFKASQREDAPPALPESLRQAAQSLLMPRLTGRQQPTASPAPASPPQSPVGPVRPVSWQQPAIHLINPASAVATPEAGALQQAIYYEASDLDGPTEK